MVNIIQSKVYKMVTQGNLIITVITKLPNYEKSSQGKVKIHKYINRQNMSTTGKLGKP